MIDNPYIQYSIYIIFGLIILALIAIKAYSVIKNKNGLKFSKDLNNNQYFSDVRNVERKVK